METTTYSHTCFCHTCFSTNKEGRDLNLTTNIASVPTPVNRSDTVNMLSVIVSFINIGLVEPQSVNTSIAPSAHPTVTIPPTMPPTYSYLEWFDLSIHAECAATILQQLELGDAANHSQSFRFEFEKGVCVHPAVWYLLHFS